MLRLWPGGGKRMAKGLTKTLWFRLVLSTVLLWGSLAPAQIPQPPAPPPPFAPPLPPPPPPPLPPAPLPVPPLPLPPAPLPVPVPARPNLYSSQAVRERIPFTEFVGWSLIHPSKVNESAPNVRYTFQRDVMVTVRNGYILLETKRGPDGQYLCLEVPASQYKQGGQVIAGPCHWGATQFFQFDYNLVHGHRITANPDRRDPQGISYCVDVYPNAMKAGSMVSVWPCHQLYSEFRSSKPLRDTQRWNWRVLDGRTGSFAISPSFIQSLPYTQYGTCLDAGDFSRGSRAVLVACETPFESSNPPRWRAIVR